MAKSGKGSSFERFLCKLLSNWASKDKNDFLFWRSVSSGALSTVRSKAGKATAGQEGDITAVHPYGELILKDLTIEAKCGYQSSTIHDLLDMPAKNKTNIYAGFIAQCIREMEDSGKQSFWLIHKRDRREATITMPYAFMQKYFDIFGDFKGFSLQYTYKDIKLITCRLEDWLEWFKPEIVFGPFEE